MPDELWTEVRDIVQETGITSKDAATGILEAQLRTNKASSLCSGDGSAYFEEEGHSADYLGWRGGGRVPS